MPLTLARGMDAGAICTCSLPTAGLPRHPPLTLSLLPRIASSATGRRRLGPRQPPPRGAGSAPSRGGAAALPGPQPDGPAEGFPPRPAGTRGEERPETWRRHAPPPPRIAPWRCVLRCAAGTPAEKAPSEQAVLALAGYEMRQRILAGAPTVQVLHTYSSEEIRSKNK